MHPAASVLLFTVLSGIGYGLLFWLGLLVAAGQAARNPTLVLVTTGIALVLVSAGLFASLFHLGRPERAWRALSQWRSSWLSREGVLAIAGFAPFVLMAASVWLGWSRPWQVASALTSSAMAVLTVYCTARIYSSLKPIPAWHGGRVTAGYLILAAASGGAWLWAIGVLGFALPGHRGDTVIVLALLSLAAGWKALYWRHIDRAPAVLSAAAALALPAGSQVRTFEAPHTEANFLLKEMGFALARKHGRRLRGIVFVLLWAIPALVLISAALRHEWRPVAAAITALCVVASLLIERWLFFAQARHVVATYYDARPS